MRRELRHLIEAGGKMDDESGGVGRKVGGSEMGGNTEEHGG